MRRTSGWMLVLGLVVAAGLATGGTDVEWFADFEGPDGQVLAPGSSWGYTNVGVEWSDWQTHRRPDAQDRYTLTNGCLYAFVGPPTNSPTTYNKVQATIRPLGPGGSPLSFASPGGGRAALVLQMDVLGASANAGNQWGLNQEFKLSLTPSPLLTDPNGVATNACKIKVRVQPSTAAGIEVWARYRARHPTTQAWTWYDVADTKPIPTPTPDHPLSLKLVLWTNGQLSFYTNDVLMASSAAGVLPLAAMPRLYLQAWHGKFNGSGGVVSDGYLLLDNMSVSRLARPTTVSVH